MGPNISAHRFFPDMRFVAVNSKYSLVSHIFELGIFNNALKPQPKMGRANSTEPKWTLCGMGVVPFLNSGWYVVVCGQLGNSKRAALKNEYFKRSYPLMLQVKWTYNDSVEY